MGWDSRCYELTTPDTDDAPFIFDTTDCDTQVRMARILELMYTGDGFDAAAQMLEYYPEATISVVPNGYGPIPGTLIATLQGRTIVIISGTTNPLQWSLQGFSGTVGLINFGQYSTLLAWRIASDAIQNRVMDATVNPTGPVSFIGHSYGGAVACILAVRARLYQPLRDIQLLTFGCPKPGDSRMVDLLRTVRQTHFVNDDDPVTYLPPSGQELGLLQAIIPDGFVSRWTRYDRPTNRIGLDTNGVRRDNPDPDDMYALLFRVVTQTVGGEEPAIIFSHLMGEYRRRLRCPQAPPPSPGPTMNIQLWTRPEELSGEVSDPLSVWTDVSGNDRHLTWNGDVTEPTIYELSGRKGVEFASTIRLLLEEPLTPGNDATVYMVVAKSAAATNNGAWFGAWPPPNAVGNVGLGHNGSDISFKGATTSVTISAPNDPDEWHLISLRKTNTTLRVDFDGSEVFTSTIPANLDLVFLGMGAYNPAPLMGSAVFGEVMILGGFASDDFHAETTYRLLQKFRIELP